MDADHPAIGVKIARRNTGLIGAPTLLGTPDPGDKRLVRAAVSNKVQGPAHAATGTLAFHASPRDELALLGPQTIDAASLSTFALTVTGAFAE